MKTTYIFLLLSVSLFANLDNYISEVQNRAIELKLHENREWHLLLHYKESFGGVESLIDDPQFFISEIGKVDPKSELRETIDSFFRSTYDVNSTLSAQCIFVERFRWLDEKLHFDREFLPKNSCSRFKTWFDEVSGEQIALIFASSYMNNPSSMFGHTFLRIDKYQKDNSLPLSYALNYSANTGDDGGVLFAFKGIFGGYPAYFSVAPYFEKIRKYNDLENRDLHEYILNLRPEEIRRLIYHSWELHFFRSDYFFFKENCSYNILTLLEYARPSLYLTDNFSTFAIPSDTVRVLVENSLISEVVYRPSKRSEIDNLLKYSSKSSQDLAQDIVDQKIEPKTILELNISQEEKINSLELAYEYLNYLRLKKSYKLDNPKSLQMKLLFARSRVGKREKSLPLPERPKYSVEDGHRVSRVGLGYSNVDGKNSLNFEIKPSYHQLLDNQAGYIDGAEISFFDTKLDLRDEVQYRLDFLKIKSFSSYGDFFRPISWNFSTGVENSFDFQKPTLFLRGGAGFTFGERVKIFSLLTLNYEYSRNWQKETQFLYGGDIGLFSSINSWWRVVFEISGERYIFNNLLNESRFKINLSNNFFIDRDNSIVFEIEREEKVEKLQNRVTIRYQYYW